MKIAFPTDDGETISAHLGRSAYYVVLELQSGAAPTRVERAKPRHTGHDHGHTAAAEGLTVLDAAPPLPVPASPTGHGGILAPVADCDVLVAGGMGAPAFDAARALGLKVILTGERSITAAADALQAGSLTSDPRRVHRH